MAAVLALIVGVRVLGLALAAGTLGYGVYNLAVFDAPTQAAFLPSMHVAAMFAPLFVFAEPPMPVWADGSAPYRASALVFYLASLGVLAAFVPAAIARQAALLPTAAADPTSGLVRVALTACALVATPALGVLLCFRPRPAAAKARKSLKETKGPPAMYTLAELLDDETLLDDPSAPRARATIRWALPFTELLVHTASWVAAWAQLGACIQLLALDTAVGVAVDAPNAVLIAVVMTWTLQPLKTVLTARRRLALAAALAAGLALALAAQEMDIRATQTAAAYLDGASYRAAFGSGNVSRLFRGAYRFEADPASFAAGTVLHQALGFAWIAVGSALMAALAARACLTSRK